MIGTLADTFANAGRDEPGLNPSLVFNWRPEPAELILFSGQWSISEPMQIGSGRSPPNVLQVW